MRLNKQLLQLVLALGKQFVVVRLDASGDDHIDANIGIGREFDGGGLSKTMDGVLTRNIDAGARKSYEGGALPTLMIRP